MLTTERRQPPQRAMAWHAAVRGETRAYIPFEGLALVALLLPLALGCLLVLAVRRDGTALSSPLIPVLGAAIAGAAALIHGIESRRRERPLRAALHINTTVVPRLLAAAAIGCSLVA
ncbi:MAG: hypothetical protein ACRDGS_08310, partial [Chloroflexota bacterium]